MRLAEAVCALGEEMIDTIVGLIESTKTFIEFMLLNGGNTKMV